MAQKVVVLKVVGIGSDTKFDFCFAERNYNFFEEDSFLFRRRSFAMITVTIFGTISLFLCFLLAFYFTDFGKGFVPDGYRCKLAELFGKKLPDMAESSWTFFPSSEEGDRSEALIISFAGGAVKLSGMPRAEFVKTMSGLQCDQLFLTDPHQSWYLQDDEGNWEGRAVLGRKIQELRDQYKYIMMVGNCLGAAGALLFCDYCDRAIVFNPFVDLEQETRTLNRWWAKRMPSELRLSLPHIFAKNISQCGQRVSIHVGAFSADREHIKSLEDASPPRSKYVVTYHEFSGEKGSLPGALKKQDMLVKMCRQEFESMLQGGN